MRPTVLDPAAPMRSLREAVGITMAEMARRRGLARQSIADSEEGLPRLATLLEVADLCGLDVEIRVRPRG